MFVETGPSTAVPNIVMTVLTIAGLIWMAYHVSLSAFTTVRAVLARRAATPIVEVEHT